MEIKSKKHTVWEHLNQRKEKWNYKLSRKQRNGEFFIGKLTGDRKNFKGNFLALSNFINKWKELDTLYDSI